MTSADIRAWFKLTVPIAIATLVIGFLTDSPEYEVLSADETEFKLVIRHSGMVMGECRIISPEEIANTPANMRRPTECPRGKAPLRVELSVDDQPYFHNTVVPSGLHNDGVLAMFEKMNLSGGVHQFDIEVRHQMIDGEQTESFSTMLDVALDRIVIAEYTDAGFRLYQPGAGG